MTTASGLLGTSALSSFGTVISALISGFDAAKGAIIATVANFSITELIKLGKLEWDNINASIKHFVANIEAKVTWSDAMSRMLTELWAATKPLLAMFVTDFVEAVGKMLMSVGLIPQAAY